MSSVAAPESDLVLTTKAAIELAWKEFRKGHSKNALLISQRLLATRKATLNNLPWAQSSLILALTDHLSGQSARAAERIYGVMSYLPELDVAMQLYLSLLQEQVIKSRSPNSGSHSGQIILGIGTGRSGSTSLSYLLATQPNTYFSHEHVPFIPWYGGERQLNFHMQRMELLAKSCGAVADVSHWWLPKLEEVIQRFPEVRVVIMQRKRQDTIDSFLKIKGYTSGGSIMNHWMVHDGKRYRHDRWDICYPKFEAEDLPQALGMYWDDYYGRAQAFQARFPNNLKIFDTDSLSSSSGQLEILQFCGYQEIVPLVDSKKNQGSVKEGQFFWKNPFNLPS